MDDRRAEVTLWCHHALDASADDSDVDDDDDDDEVEKDNEEEEEEEEMEEKEMIPCIIKMIRINDFRDGWTETRHISMQEIHYCKHCRSLIAIWFPNILGQLNLCLGDHSGRRGRADGVKSKRN